MKCFMNECELCFELFISSIHFLLFVLQLIQGVATVLSLYCCYHFFCCCSRGSEFKQFLPRIKIYCSVDTVIYRLNFVFTLRFFLFQHFRLYSCTFFPTKVSHSIIYFHTPVALHLIYETVSAIFGIMVEDLINFKTLMDFLLIVPQFARADASNMSCHGDCKIHVTFTYLISPLYCGYNLY